MICAGIVLRICVQHAIGHALVEQARACSSQSDAGERSYTPMRSDRCSFSGPKCYKSCAAAHPVELAALRIDQRVGRAIVRRVGET